MSSLEWQAWIGSIPNHMQPRELGELIYKHGFGIPAHLFVHPPQSKDRNGDKWGIATFCTVEDAQKFRAAGDNGLCFANGTYAQIREATCKPRYGGGREWSNLQDAITGIQSVINTQAAWIGHLVQHAHAAGSSVGHQGALPAHWLMIIDNPAHCRIYCCTTMTSGIS